MLLPLLVLGLVLTVPAWAQNDSYTWNPYDSPAAPDVVFRYTPSWTMVPGTSVYMIREGERPGYDLFRFGSTYYVYNDGYWYSATDLNGRYVAINPGSVPTQISAVPRSYWVDYPAQWSNQGDTRYRRNAPAPPAINLRYAPNWAMIPGTNVYGVRAGEGPDFDMFRVNGDYYLYANETWYRSDYWNTRYTPVSFTSIPSDLRNVPRRYWISYPADWRSNSNSRWNRNDGTYTNYEAPPAPRVVMRRNPNWRPVAGTSVYMIRRPERPNFDIFRYAGQYYIYNDGYWYRSNRVTGPYATITENSVPDEFHDVPRGQWRNPPTWVSNASYNRR